MESTIADWVLGHNPKTKKEFIEELCVKGFPQLLKYIELHEMLSQKGFIFEPARFKNFIFSKGYVMDMIKRGILINKTDFIVNEEGNEIFNSRGMMKILSKETKDYLGNLDYLEFEYKMYVSDINELRIDV